MNKFIKYLKEAKHLETLDETYGFVTYYVEKDICYIHDFYVDPMFRKALNSAKLLKTLREKIMPGNQVKMFVVCINTKEHFASKAIKLFLNLGFKITGINMNSLILEFSFKSIKNDFKLI